MRRTVLAVMLVGLLAAGCAGKPPRRVDLGQLHTQVASLDQRVADLEFEVRGLQSRSATTELPAAPSPAGTAIQVPVTAGPAASTTPATRDIQQALANAGFYQGPIDGKSGPLTQDAIRAFQQANGLQVDGKVGPQTWARLSTYLGLASGSADASATEFIK